MRVTGGAIFSTGIRYNFVEPTLPPAPIVSLIPINSTSIQVNITSTPLQGSSVTNYLVDRSTDQLSWNSANISTGSANYTYTDTGLAVGTQYYYRARVVTTAATTSPISTVKTASTSANTESPIVQSGLLFSYDFSNISSYLGSGTTIIDVSP